MKRFTLLLTLLLITACTTQTAGRESTGITTEGITFKPVTIEHYDPSVKPTTLFIEPISPVVKPKPKIKVPQVKPKTVEIKPKVVKQPTVSRSGSKAYALARLGTKQFLCIENLWNRESGWNYKALNRSSGAYGIPQALPGSKMATAGADWKTNPITQIKWGIRYVNSRYGSACGAWNFWKSNHWY